MFERWTMRSPSGDYVATTWLNARGSERQRPISSEFEVTLENGEVVVEGELNANAEAMLDAYGGRA